MNSFENLAAPAPRVEAAMAAPVVASSDNLEVEPARPSEDAKVEAASAVGPAVPFDDPKKFAPPMSAEVASQLSVAALREGSGPEFESKVS